MSYQFSNNWPYSGTGFPSMDDHVDPVNNAYFAGLHDEIQTIEYFLGIHPQGAYKDVAERLAGFDFSVSDNYDSLVSIIQTNYDFLFLRGDNYNDAIWNTLHPDVAEDFDDVKDKLETHGHTGGTDGKQLVVPEPGTWEDISFVGTPSYLYIEQFVTGGSFSGFAYFDILYGGPVAISAGGSYITAFNTATEDFNWQPTNAPAAGNKALWTGQYGIFAMSVSPGKIVRFNPATWEEIITTLDTGDNLPRQMCEQDTNVWFPTFSSPARIIRYTPATHAHTAWVMSAGENECNACCTDGTYIWTCCNTNPVKLIKFKISDKSHIAYTLTGLLPEITYMFYYNGMVYMFSNNATPQWARFHPGILGLQRWETDWPAGVDSGCEAEGRHLLALGTGNGGYLIQFDVVNFVFYISIVIGGAGSMDGIRYTNNRVSYFQDPYQDQEAPITIIDI